MLIRPRLRVRRVPRAPRGDLHRRGPDPDDLRSIIGPESTAAGARELPMTWMFGGEGAPNRSRSGRILLDMETLFLVIIQP